MIIKSIFRRYERWNPVHPTNGTFWGVGVGIGCGVGWGPGFGPEVVGYVGAGCGAGFSVGITFVGLGIGLPANYLLEVPRSAIMVTARGMLDVVRAGGLHVRAGDSWGSHISDVQQNMKSMLVSNARHVTDRLQRVREHFDSKN